MDLASLSLLLAAGAAGGFLVGLVGVGGGIVYAPALLFFLRARGVEDPVLTPLVLGSSLLCVGAAALSGALRQWRAGAVHARVALVSGLAAAAAVTATGRLVTTRPWYDARAFAAVFGGVLLLVAVRMVWPGNRSAEVEAGAAAPRTGTALLAVAGLLAGALSVLAGVGGGTVLVPLYNGPVRLPLKTAVGTSAAAIVLVAAAGVVTYAVLGWGAPVPPGSVGYVDVGHALVLVAPALVTARWGVDVAQRVDARWIRYGFAALATAMAARLLWGAPA